VVTRQTDLVQARPNAVSIAPERTALIVIDMQNDFGSKGGMFDRAGIDISGIRSVIEPTRRAIGAAREAGIQIVYAKMGYRPDLSDIGGPEAPNRLLHVNRMAVGQTITAPDGRKGGILIRDTWGTDIVDELKPEAEDIVFYKTRYSGFYRTELDDILRKAGITHLIVAGCTTSICVESTIRDAFFRDYQCVLLTDCTAEPIGAHEARSNHDATLTVMELMFARLSTSHEFMTAVAPTAVRLAG
jgi:ureidoacrylate peracid hydrolase